MSIEKLIDEGIDQWLTSVDQAELDEFCDLVEAAGKEGKLDELAALDAQEFLESLDESGILEAEEENIEGALEEFIEVLSEARGALGPKSWRHTLSREFAGAHQGLLARAEAHGSRQHSAMKGYLGRKFKAALALYRTSRFPGRVSGTTNSYWAGMAHNLAKGKEGMHSMRQRLLKAAGKSSSAGKAAQIIKWGARKNKKQGPSSIAHPFRGQGRHRDTL